MEKIPSWIIDTAKKIDLRKEGSLIQSVSFELADFIAQTVWAHARKEFPLPFGEPPVAYVVTFVNNRPLLLRRGFNLCSIRHCSLEVSRQFLTDVRNGFIDQYRFPVG